MILQELHDAGVTKVTRSPESSSAIVCSQSGICSCFQKLLHYLHVTLLARYVERASSVLLGLVDACSPSQKLLHYLYVTLLWSTGVSRDIVSTRWSCPCHTTHTAYCSFLSTPHLPCTMLVRVVVGQKRAELFEQT